ncbi:3-demethylubiquinol 3-O-methyltransferase [Planctomycetales bacterium 10988]|nr:3-demethylubiquinol 3-O-methyltransferase [Planctomycetales bacterium 10988]
MLLNTLSNLEYRCYYRPIYRSQARRIKKTWKKNHKSNDNPRLLDMGCGRGLRMQALSEEGFKVEGLDFQPHLTEQPSPLELNIQYADATTTQLPWPDQTFDIITAFFLLEHVPDVRAVLRSVRRLLKPGGLFFATIPLIDSLQAKWWKDRWIHITEAPRHLSLPSRKGLKLVCKTMGFQETTIQADSILEEAGVAASSLLPQASITDVYGNRKVTSLMRRLFGASSLLITFNFCFLTSILFRSPGHGFLCTRKS